LAIRRLRSPSTGSIGQICLVVNTISLAWGDQDALGNEAREKERSSIGMGRALGLEAIQLFWHR
jgi:hypothetical protein